MNDVTLCCFLDEKNQYQSCSSGEENSDSDLEHLHEENKKYRPYRDQHLEDKEKPIQRTTLAKSSKSYTEKDISERVKKSLSKTQRHTHRRKVKKGEASLATEKKNEQRYVIKDSW